MGLFTGSIRTATSDGCDLMNLTAEKRSEIAQKAVVASWKDKPAKV